MSYVLINGESKAVLDLVVPSPLWNALKVMRINIMDT